MRKWKAAGRPLAWIALGWGLGALTFLGPRVALNRALDHGYSLAAWLSSLV